MAADHAFSRPIFPNMSDSIAVSLRPNSAASQPRGVVLLIALLSIALTATPTAGAAQQPDSTRRPRTRADSLRVDSIARADSIALVRELERLQNEPRAAGAQPPSAQQGPSNARLMPDISAIGEVIGDFTPNVVTQESGKRFDIREVELALSSAVDPYFRADFILGLSDLERIAIEEAYITSTALPWGLQARIGRFHMPIGKQNTTHRAELQTVEYPYVIQNFLGAEASKGTGISLSAIVAPFGFYQEFQVSAVDNFFGEEEEELVTEKGPNERLSGLGYAGRFRNYIDLTEATNIEISASAATGLRAQPISCGALSCSADAGPTGTNARQSIVGADLTLRWRPLQQALYKSFILQAEVMRQINEKDPDLPPLPGTNVSYAGPTRDNTGAYVMGRFQLARRRYVGARYDWLEDPNADGRRFQAVSAYFQFFPSEFSKFVLAYERTMPAGGEKKLNRILLQSTFAVGPHRPHPF